MRQISLFSEQIYHAPAPVGLFSCVNIKVESQSPPRTHFSSCSVPKYLLYTRSRKESWFRLQWIWNFWWSTGTALSSFLPALYKAGGKDLKRPNVLTKDHGKFKLFINTDLWFLRDVLYSSWVFLWFGFCFHCLFLSWVLGQNYHSLNRKGKGFFIFTVPN